MASSSNIFSSAVALAEKAKANAAAAATSASARISDSGLRESLESARGAIAVKASAAQSAATESISSLQSAMDDNDRVDVMLRDKNRRILELEEERSRLHAQLRKSGGEALADAMAEAKQRTGELESLKERTVGKFKAMAKEKAELEERIASLQRSAGPPSTPSAFDSPATGSGSSLATPPTGNGNGNSPEGARRLADAAAELKKAREAIGWRDSQLTELRAKGREMLNRLKIENAELQRRLNVAAKSQEAAEESATEALARVTAAEARAAEAETKAAAAEQRAAAEAQRAVEADARAEAAVADAAAAAAASGGGIGAVSIASTDVVTIGSSPALLLTPEPIVGTASGPSTPGWLREAADDAAASNEASGSSPAKEDEAATMAQQAAIARAEAAEAEAALARQAVAQADGRAADGRAQGGGRHDVS